MKKTGKKESANILTLYEATNEDAANEDVTLPVPINWKFEVEKLSTAIKDFALLVYSENLSLDDLKKVITVFDSMKILSKCFDKVAENIREKI